MLALITRLIYRDMFNYLYGKAYAHTGDEMTHTFIW
jgi:hypothetical protein